MPIFEKAIAAAKAAVLLGRSKIEPMARTPLPEHMPESCDCGLVYYHGTSGDRPGALQVPADGWWTKHIGGTGVNSVRDDTGKVIGFAVMKPGPSQSWRLFS